MPNPPNILFAASEMLPLAKTGGLADVAAALPAALVGLGADVRVAMPAYRGILAGLAQVRALGTLHAAGHEFRILEHDPGGGAARVWLVDCPQLYDREGNAYHDARFQPWPDNALRFGAFCQVVARLGLGELGGWRPDVVHANDWQTGLIPAWLATAAVRPRSVFTVHNLAYQGVFGRDQFERLGLPDWLWSIDGVEYHGQLSFMKAGIALADAITTVSPSYSYEILTPEQGHGLDGLLRERQPRLRGILNGIDARLWNPSGDALIARTYDAATVAEGKAANKRALQAVLRLEPDPEVPLIGLIGRLTYQKGTDLVLQALPRLLALDVQVAMLGSGEPSEEQAWRDWMLRAPGRVGARIAYEEALAHQIEAGADIFLMPSRFEPCGLNQMYSQRYGTIPAVRRVGGLADTVVDATDETLQAGTATGVCFDHADIGGVLYGVRRALELHRDPAARASLQQAGMRRDFSWGAAARAYLQLYAELAAGR